MTKRLILWVGDAGVATGFERATKHVCSELVKLEYDVHVMGLHYAGDPHNYPFPVWPTRRTGQQPDLLGHKRLPELVERLQPDAVIIQNDVWNIPPYVRELRAANLTVPVVAAVAIDGKNVQGKKLDDCALTIFWTEFAKREARLGGHIGPGIVIPLGVDLEKYKLVDFSHASQLRTHARSLLETTLDARIDLEKMKKGFIVLNVNRNQSRKRLDLTVQCFCEWVKEKNIDDAFLMIQAAPTGEAEYDIYQLMEYYGCVDRLSIYYPDKGEGIPENDLVWTYRCADVGITTTQGEGFGLTTFEMMALGIPTIVPAWSALEELTENACVQVQCPTTATTGFVNAIGGVPDKRGVIDALDLLYRDRDLRDQWAQKGLARVREPRFRWENIGKAYAEALEQYVFLPPVPVEDQDIWSDRKEECAV